MKKRLFCLTLTALMILSSCSNSTDHVIEALSAASAKYIKEALIEKSIKDKVLRDKESVEVYRMMRDNSVYEFSCYNDPSNMYTSYYGTLFWRGIILKIS